MPTVKWGICKKKFTIYSTVTVQKHCGWSHVTFIEPWYSWCKNTMDMSTAAVKGVLWMVGFYIPRGKVQLGWKILVDWVSLKFQGTKRSCDLTIDRCMFCIIRSASMIWRQKGSLFVYMTFVLLTRISLVSLVLSQLFHIK